MTKQPEQEYYLARIAAERAAAELARTDEARTIHLDLAEQYQRIVDGEREPPSPAP
jgi:hypothetical protein